MPTTARAYGKINIGLLIGAARDDGFHELRTVYQTIALHDTVRVEAKSSGAGIEIRCRDSRVPCDETNTCYRVAERVLRLLKKRARIAIAIEKKLPVQGGLGAASSDGVAAMLALERELREPIPPEEKLRIAAEVGSDLPLFALGGAVLGIGRGEQVFPLPDLPQLHCVVALPQVAVSTPKAFERWDEQTGNGQSSRFAAGAARRLGYAPADPFSGAGKLTEAADSDRINLFSRSLHEWLGGYLSQPANGEPGPPARSGGVGPAKSGVPRGRKHKDCGDRAEALLLDLVRAGIENDFERVVFPEYPELREVKRALERNGARYSSLSGSGSALYGLFASHDAAEKCCAALLESGTRAVVTRTLGRAEYWKTILG